MLICTAKEAILFFRVLAPLVLFSMVINAQSPTASGSSAAKEETPATVSLPTAQNAFPSIGSADVHGTSGTEKIGPGVSAPVPLKTPQAKYTREARKKKIEGVCVVSVIVDANGIPRNPSVIQTVGYGLDESAVAAVKKFRFKPSMKDGHPVAVEMNIQVNFRIY